MALQSYGDKFLNNSIISDALMYDKPMEMAQEAIKKDPSLTTSEEYKRFMAASYIFCAAIIRLSEAYLTLAIEAGSIQDGWLLDHRGQFRGNGA